MYAATLPVRLDGPERNPKDEKKPADWDWLFLAGAGGAATPADPRTGAAGLAGGALRVGAGGGALPCRKRF